MTNARITFFDNSGHYLSHRMYPDSVSPEFFSGWIEAILALDDGGLLFAALARIPPYRPDGMWLARLNSQGDIVWTSRIRTGTDSVYIKVSSVIQLVDNSFLSACYFVAPSRSHFVLNKVNQEGSVVWDSVYTMEILTYPQNTQLAACPDGGWVAALTDRPSSNYDHARLLRFNSNGDTLWSWSIGEEWEDYTGVAVTCLRNSGFMLGGENADYGDTLRVWTLLVRTEPERSDASDPPSVVPDDFLLEPVYPNPFNATVTIEFTLKRPAVVRLRLYDLLGREAAIVYDGWTPAGNHCFPLHAENLASGEYFLRGEALGIETTQKIALIK
ncbi:T9SS C-terminal target domain-containing protein [candidate division KSB1 bacterium]|nr:MAG: T9SS C-terminal target domain-containing protein [candidate division KSB1 bacterium]